MIPPAPRRGGKVVLLCRKQDKKQVTEYITGNYIKVSSNTLHYLGQSESSKTGSNFINFSGTVKFAVLDLRKGQN